MDAADEEEAACRAQGRPAPAPAPGGVLVTRQHVNKAIQEIYGSVHMEFLRACRCVTPRCCILSPPCALGLTVSPLSGCCDGCYARLRCLCELPCAPSPPCSLMEKALMVALMLEMRSSKKAYATVQVRAGTAGAKTATPSSELHVPLFRLRTDLALLLHNAPRPIPFPPYPSPPTRPFTTG